MCVRRISLGGEGNALYPLLSSYNFFLPISVTTFGVACKFYWQMIFL